MAKKTMSNENEKNPKLPLGSIKAAKSSISKNRPAEKITSSAPVVVMSKGQAPKREKSVFPNVSVGSLKTNKTKERTADGSIRKQNIVEGRLGKSRIKVEKSKVKNPSEGQKMKTTNIKVETPKRKIELTKQKGQRAEYSYTKR